MSHCKDCAIKDGLIEILKEAFREMQVQRDTYHTPLLNLSKKLREIEDNDAFQGVWQLHYVHGGRYTGPDWASELVDAEKALS